MGLFGAIEHVHTDDRELIERHLAPLPGPVLDLGCGPGQLTGYLHSLGVEVTGIDPVPEFIEHARATHPGARFEVGSMLELDRPAGSIAGILAWFSLIHLEPALVDDVLATIRRVMRPGGVLVAGFFDGAAVEPFAHKVITAHRWPIDEMARRLVLAGFVVTERLQRARAGESRSSAAVVATAV
ncbi:methyltransferase type 11 [Blastococcus sp. CCUG 61487]|nr:methyltransferase type 11 [Blastococcus sp. CCUG 61487]